MVMRRRNLSLKYNPPPTAIPDPCQFRAAKKLLVLYRVVLHDKGCSQALTIFG